MIISMYISFAVKQWTCRKTTMVVLTWKMGTSQFQMLQQEKTFKTRFKKLDQETKLWPFPINPGILVQFMQGMGVMVAGLEAAICQRFPFEFSG